MTIHQQASDWLAADWLASIMGRLLCGCSDRSASLNPSEVIWYWTEVSMWPGDLKMAATLRESSHCRWSLIVGAWPQLSPRAGTSSDWLPRSRVVMWLVTTTATLCLVAMAMSRWARFWSRRVLFDKLSNSLNGNATLSITRRRVCGCSDRKSFSRWSSANSST